MSGEISIVFRGSFSSLTEQNVCEDTGTGTGLSSRMLDVVSRAIKEGDAVTVSMEKRVQTRPLKNVGGVLYNCREMRQILLCESLSTERLQHLSEDVERDIESLSRVMSRIPSLLRFPEQALSLQSLIFRLKDASDEVRKVLIMKMPYIDFYNFDVLPDEGKKLRETLEEIRAQVENVE